MPYLLDWFRLATFFFVVLNYLGLIWDLDFKTKILVYNSNYVNSSSALPSILVLLCGLAALWLGEKLIFSSRNGAIKKKFNPLNQCKKSKKEILVFRNRKTFHGLVFCVGISQVILITRGITGYAAIPIGSASVFSVFIQITNVLNPILLAILAILVLRYKYNSGRISFIFKAFLLLQILLGFVTGMKEAILTPLVIVVVPYILTRKKISNVLILCLAIFAFLLYPVNNTYRTILHESNNLGRVESVKKAVATTIENGFVENLVTGAESYQGRLSLFPILMYSVENEQIWTEFKYLNRYIYLPIAWVIPRFLIPNKPTANSGSILYEITTGNDTSSITPTTYGWSFFEGGLITVFLTFFLFSIFISFINTKSDVNTMFGLLLYILIMVDLLKVESDIFFLISGILQTVFLIVIINYLFFKKRTSVYVRNRITI
ncbi:hypothetical protein RB2501_01161 [Robiginitalea biformata HTCC2501]|uniref:Oligosaccharide repeat unit polymerase n=2 Tax=Robiginitalea TaxID=252306 RepID=A4CP25_ROBBH|nr:hypothetical protein RB2501_01161 [Robiginitalea biformata HTCC2501]